MVLRAPAAARGFAEPELAHEVGERVREGAADEPCNYLRRLGSRLRAAAMDQRAESEDAAEPRPQQACVLENASRFVVLYISPILSIRLLESLM